MPTLRRLAPPAVLLVLAASVSVQTGHAFGKQLFGAIGPGGVVTLRLGFAAVVLLAVYRPRLADHRLPLLLAFGVAIAGMNLVYPALQYLPLGVASTIQLLGPLAVALLASRRRLDVLFVLLAAAGVWLCRDPAAGEVQLPGLLLAAASAVAMGGYLVLSRRAGASSVDGSALAVAVSVAALLSLPFGIADGGAALLQPGVLLAGLGVAVLSAVLPYSFEFAALRRLPAGVVGVLVCLEPAVAGVAGYLVLAERLGPAAWVGIGCVVAAAAGITARAAARDKVANGRTYSPTRGIRRQQLDNAAGGLKCPTAGDRSVDN
jgi:inner membrane transporter RhtA